MLGAGCGGRIQLHHLPSETILVRAALRLEYDDVTDLTLGIWSHVRLKRSKRDGDEEAQDMDVLDTISKHGGATEFSRSDIAMVLGIIVHRFWYKFKSSGRHISRVSKKKKAGRTEPLIALPLLFKGAQFEVPWHRSNR
ncbi:hypothetical protein J6590_063803 [Homalodisca vitripennis]|nr:hypothetical protein J6590_063803 [Homalodisca vitripennis]